MTTTASDPASEIAKGLRLRKFFEIEARMLQERYRVIETLLPNQSTRGAAHHGEEGRYIESLLRAFLNKHLPGSLKAVSGFVLCPATKTGISNLERVKEYPDRHSRQIDIIVYDFDAYPVYERFEDFCVVPPEGVIGLISVKKTIYLPNLARELNDLRGAAMLCAHPKRRGPFTAVFGFASDTKEPDDLNAKAFKCIEKAYNKAGDFDSMINEISIMEQTCIFKVRSEHAVAKKARYIGVDCRREIHIPLQRLIQSLMSVYYDPTRGSNRERPGFVSFMRSTFKDSPQLGLVDYKSVQPE